MFLSFPDPWLDRWLELIKLRCAERPILEIGCGYGDDTETLVNAGIRVTGFDVSEEAVAATKARVPSACIEQRDIRDGLPSEAINLGVVIASLSLHYFTWAETEKIVDQIRLALRPGGILLCRLNSTEDRNFGAGQGIEIEPGYFRIQDELKRFFDARAVDRLFEHGWDRLSVEHITTRKYQMEKAVWEIVLERVN